MMRQGSWLVSCLLLVTLEFLGADAGKPTQEGLVYGRASAGAGDALKLDYYAGAGVGAHPIAIVLDGGKDAAALTQAGYDVFILPGPQQVEKVERAVRYVRFHAREWNADNRKIALVGSSDAGYLSIVVGLMNASGVMGSEDSVDRESGRVQAVVAIWGTPVSENVPALLSQLLAEKAREASLAQAPAIDYVDPSAPSVLLLAGGTDDATGSAQTTALQVELRKVGVHCDALRSSGGQEWERQVAGWLNQTLTHR